MHYEKLPPHACMLILSRISWLVIIGGKSADPTDMLVRVAPFLQFKETFMFACTSSKKFELVVAANGTDEAESVFIQLSSSCTNVRANKVMM